MNFKDSASHVQSPLAVNFYHAMRFYVSFHPLVESRTSNLLGIFRNVYTKKMNLKIEDYKFSSSKSILRFRLAQMTLDQSVCLQTIEFNDSSSIYLPVEVCALMQCEPNKIINHYTVFNLVEMRGYETILNGQFSKWAFPNFTKHNPSLLMVMH